MTVAFDAFSNSGGTNDTHSWTHTPVGTPRGVLVKVVHHSGVGVDRVTGITYGGTAMSEVTGSPNLKATGEVGAVHSFFLGASIPTGAQTVAVTLSTSGGSVMSAAVTLTADADTEVVTSDATINSGSVENPSAVLSLGGRSSFAMIAFHSGQNAVSGITPLTDWTARQEHAAGAVNTKGWYTYDTIGTADVTAGWTQTADDAVAIAVAIAEVVAVKHRRTLLGVGA